MHAIKGGWVGQTFARAKSNESEGRKSRIRRSKEERKTMVESFINKYQSSHNGSFPSLNLTHKEVGGSFYTVREIVREIIQENRVLGPAKLTSGELNNGQFDRQYPLGSISRGPQTPLNISSNGSYFVSNHHQGRSEEPVSISDEIYRIDENQTFDSEGIINISQVDMTIKESAKKTFEELQASKPLQAEEQVDKSAASTAVETPITADLLVATSKPLQAEEQVDKSAASTAVVIPITAEVLVATSKPLQAEEQVDKSAASTAVVTPITAEVVVETFPIRPFPKVADYADAKSRVQNLTETLEENEIEKLDLEPGNSSAPLDQTNATKTSYLLDEEKEKSLAGLVSDMNSDLMNEELELVENSTDPQLKSSNCSITVEDTVRDTIVGKVVKVEVSRNDALTSEIYDKSRGIDGTKEINASNGKIPTGSRTPNGNAIVTKIAADVQLRGNSQKGGKPTLDRIHLESWEGTSRNSAETNPLVAFFKSFVTAFIKFWSE